MLTLQRGAGNLGYARGSMHVADVVYMRLVQLHSLSVGRHT
jgi:hypothetical protein